MAEVCIVVSYPVIDCPIEFLFDAILSTGDGNAGICEVRVEYCSASYI